MICGLTTGGLLTTASVLGVPALYITFLLPTSRHFRISSPATIFIPLQLHNYHIRVPTSEYQLLYVFIYLCFLLRYYILVAYETEESFVRATTSLSLVEAVASAQPISTLVPPKIEILKRSAKPNKRTSPSIVYHARRNDRNL